jgi:hypothetical protein
VHAVADQDHPAGLARLALVVAVVVVVAVMLVMVRMAQDGQFFKQEERQQAAQQGGEQAARAGLDSNASGKACSSEVDSMMPTDRLTMRSTSLDSSVNENTAAAVMLTTPASVVARMMETSTGSML